LSNGITRKEYAERRVDRRRERKEESENWNEGQQIEIERSTRVVHHGMLVRTGGCFKEHQPVFCALLKHGAINPEANM
jgi:hypothetical protein